MHYKKGALYLFPGGSAAGHFQRGTAGEPAEAKLPRERLAGAADRETDDGETADRPGGRHRRLLLHRSAIATSAPAGPTDDLLLLLDGDIVVFDVVVVVVVPSGRRRCLSVQECRRYHRRLPAASSCFCDGRRGDDADAR